MYNENKESLSSAQEKMVEDLKRNGIAFICLEDLFPGQSMLPKLQEYTQSLYGQARQRTKAKGYLMDLLDKRPVLDFKNPFVSLMANPGILNIVNGYMEMWSKFFFMNLNITTPMPAGSEAVSSQLWHRDPEDRKMCKIFIYLNDVDENSGPFIYVKGSHYSGKWGQLFRQKPPRGFYPPKGAVENIVPENDVVTAIGPAGTVILCDTSGLHKGGYAKSNERHMFTGGFFSASSLWPQKYDYPPDYAQEIKKMSYVSRYTLEK